MYGNKLVVKTYKYVKKRNYFTFIQKFHPEVFYKRDVSEHFRSSRPVRLRPATLSKMRLWHRCFPVNFVKFLRTPFFNRTPPVAASDLCTTAFIHYMSGE